jgi:hypothetical protein
MTEEIPINYDDTTKNDELRELIEEWRHSLYTNETENIVRNSCADELEAVIDDE